MFMEGTRVASYMGGGGLILGIFVAYVVFFAGRWYCGAQKREFLKR